MNTHIILKRIPGVNVEVGSEVDASEWRNTRLLVEQRYLKALDGVEAPVNLASPEIADLRGQVTEIVLADFREDGPIAHALRSIVPGARNTRGKQVTSES